MDKGRMMLGALLISMMFTLTVTLSAMAGQKMLKFSSPYGETNPMTSSMQWFGKELEKRTNGQCKARFFFSGTMGKAPDMPELCRNGVIDFVFSGLGYTPHIFKLSRGLELMYITENPHASGAALWDLYNNYAPLRDEWEKNRLMIVFPASIDIMACHSKDHIEGVEDIKGKKFRSYAAVAEMIKIWGGSPIALSYAEIYDALNRGVLEGAFGIPTLNVYASRFWEVAPYVFNTGAGIYACTYFAMSKKTYDRFPDDIRKIVDELRKEGMARHREWMTKTEREMFQKIREQKSIRIINWSQEQKERGRKLAVPKIWDTWLNEMKASNLPGKEFLEKYKGLVAKYEKEYPYKDPFTY